MAYLNVDDLYTTPAHGAAPSTRTDLRQSGFSPLEWSVIALARRDGLGSLTPPGRLGRALRRVFGHRGAAALADPRLEALRRLAVLAWRRGFALPAAEVERFVAMGYAPAQVETLVSATTGITLRA